MPKKNALSDEFLAKIKQQIADHNKAISDKYSFDFVLEKPKKHCISTIKWIPTAKRMC